MEYSIVLKEELFSQIASQYRRPEGNKLFMTKSLKLSNLN